jgi:very-short-patch-repair endonuclease
VRTRYLEAQGFRVIRFWNPDLLRDMAAALETIKESLP